MSATTEVIVRKPEARRQIPVGKTKFEEDIVRLDKVYLGPRCVGFTQSSINRLIAELIAESAGAPKIVPAPNKQRVPKQRTVSEG